MPQDESVLRLTPEEAAAAMAAWNECGDAREFACRVLAAVMNAMMDREAQEACGAGRNERSAGRANSRNGYRSRSPETAVGDVELDIPKPGEGTYYPEGMLDRWSRVDVSVAAIAQGTCVCGVSTRKVERVAERLGISSLSSSEVSRLCDGLDADVEETRTRDLSGTPCCHLWLDATYMSCRDGSSVSSRGIVTAIGLGADGRKHLLGADAVDTESEESWCSFLSGLRARGLSGVRLVVSDDHAGLVAAVARQLQGCAWQRCLTHLQRDLRSAMAGRPRRRYRVVQTFPSVNSMVRPARSAVMEEEGRWATRRTFSGKPAALGSAGPSPAEPMTDARRRVLERRAEQIVSEIVERHGLKRE